ncbi:hypothetical protein NFI96_023713, partial [Prochilodus magdalenae]
GPQIASVTLAAYECGSVDFLEPRYPDQINQIICPQNFTTRAKLAVQNMVQKVGFFGIPGCASKLFVIITFSKDIVEQMVSFTGLYNWHLPK